MTPEALRNWAKGLRTGSSILEVFAAPCSQTRQILQVQHGSVDSVRQDRYKWTSRPIDSSNMSRAVRVAKVSSAPFFMIFGMVARAVEQAELRSSSSSTGPISRASCTFLESNLRNEEDVPCSQPRLQSRVDPTPLCSDSTMKANRLGSGLPSRMLLNVDTGTGS